MGLLFDIQTDKKQAGGLNLFFLISLNGISYCVFDSENLCTDIYLYSFPTDTSPDNITDRTQAILDQQKLQPGSFNKITIVYSFIDSILVPDEYYQPQNNSDLIGLVFGNNSNTVIRDDFNFQKNIHNVYQVPKELDLYLNRYFLHANFTHLCSLLPNSHSDPGNHLYAVFSNANFWLMLVGDGQFKMVQNFTYKSPEDVSFYLLKACESFNLKPDDVLIHVSGMIEEQSNLYAELYKYFIQMRFVELSPRFQYPEVFNQYPSHYFSYLFFLAQCV